MPTQVQSDVPEIYRWRVFSSLNLSMVSVREMGGFPVVLPPHVTLSTVAEAPPPKLPRHKDGAIKQLGLPERSREGAI